ncbi:hypothetical protein SLA2020_529250 [Shorea laevis]
MGKVQDPTTLVVETGTSAQALLLVILACCGPVNIGPGAGGQDEGSAGGSHNTFNAPANLASRFPCF